MASPESWRSPTWRHAHPGELQRGRVGMLGRASIAIAMFVPRSVYRPRTISGAFQTAITSLAVPSQRHRDPLTPERAWDLIRVQRCLESVLIWRKGLGSSYGLSPRDPVADLRVLRRSLENSSLCSRVSWTSGNRRS